MDRKLFTDALARTQAGQKTRIEDKVVLKRLSSLGVESAVISSGWEEVVKPVAVKLGVKRCQANSVKFNDKEEFAGTTVLVSGEKIREVAGLCERIGIPLDEVAYVGDSRFDFPVMKWLIECGGRAFYLKPRLASVIPPSGAIQIQHLTDILNYVK